MSLLKQIAQSLFKQQKQKHRMTRRMPLRTPMSTQRRKQIRRPTVPAQRERVVQREPEKKPKGKGKNIFKTVVTIASKFTGKSERELSSIKLTKIPLPDKRNGKLRIQATNMESWFSGTIPHRDDNNTNPMGQVCIDIGRAKLAAAWLNGSTDTIKLKGTGVQINDTFVPASCSVKTFPSISMTEDTDERKGRTYNIPDLGQCIPFLVKVLGTHARSDREYIFFDLKRGKLVTTDGHRMHIVPTGKAAHNPNYTGKDILMQKSILKVSKVLSGAFQLQQDRYIIFTLDVPDCQAEAGYLLMEGQFPRYTEVMPREFSGKYIADKAEMLYVLKQAIPTTNDESTGIRFDFSKNGVRLRNLCKPVFKTALHKGKHEGAAFIGGIDPKFLFDAICHIPDETIEISLPKDRNMAWLIKGVKSKYIAVIMPVDIQGPKKAKTNKAAKKREKPSRVKTHRPGRNIRPAKKISTI